MRGKLRVTVFHGAPFISKVCYRPGRINECDITHIESDGFIVMGHRRLATNLKDREVVVHAVEAESEDAVRAVLARDPWSETHLHLDTIDPWTIRLDGRAA